MIELLMTIALILYFVAYFIARNKGKYFLAHVPIALIGFIFNLYGTFIMLTTLNTVNYTPILIIHISLTLLALSLFFIQGYLGITEQAKKHRFFAEKIFLPVWIISFLSGFLFLI